MCRAEDRVQWCVMGNFIQHTWKWAEYDNNDDGKCIQERQMAVISEELQLYNNRKPLQNYFVWILNC